MLTLALLALAAASDLVPSGAPGVAAVSEKEIRADVRFLADDLLEGRRAGEPGHHVAALYVASRMEALGLRPAGTSGFLQPVALREVRAEASGSSVTLSAASGGAEENVRVPEEATVSADPGRAVAEAEGPITFVGFGLCPAGAGAGAGANARDLEGRVALVLGGPAASDNASKWRCLAARGAVAMVTLRTPAQEAAVPWRVRGASGRAEVGLAEPSPLSPPLSATLDRPAAERLLGRAGRRLADEVERARAGALSDPLPLRIRLRRSGLFRELASENVVGLLEGRDPRRRSELVVVSAHVDHHGLCRDEGADRICNGAIDNASGIAQLLAVARAFTVLPRPPARSVLFLATTAEELGLHGAEYFVRHPTVPREGIVADLNIDQAGMLWPIHDVVADGAQMSSLAAHAEAAAAALGLVLSPDPVPEQGFFARSDQYPFARAGIPALIARPGFKDAQGGTDVNAGLFRQWRANTYHSPADQLDQKPPIDFGSGATMARFYFLMALSVAEAESRPAWNPSSPFRPASSP